MECPREEDSDEAAMKGLNMFINRQRYLNLDWHLVVDLGPRTNTETCEIDPEESRGFCWVSFYGIFISVGRSTKMEVNMNYIKVKARVFFQPDSFEVYRFENFVVSEHDFYGETNTNGKRESFKLTEEQRASTERLLLQALDQSSFRCYREWLTY